ncbi:hypothetical protein Rsub_08777 [Raphidocelis subcapitata]|uniref:Apyrase n=1 Tax=Raphidocelis subcapitata TaxID=307507 RepID=A0A2V0PBB8_9CHLO|nr:hypothetical protein Rsub_08777 [Raphidocelis subcapitata]|eukprot:GBF96232.1 hypothetical protein Rsub_08777 [Raphidocelis subcapitata]
MFKRKERLRDRLWRLRGLGFVGFVAALLLLAARASPPRAAPPPPPLGRRFGPRGAAASPPAAALLEGEQAVHSVVIDAGSTGSRVSVYRFARGAGGALRLLNATFSAVKPGLSSYADAPSAAAASLRPLLEAAAGTVTPAEAAGTALSLKATAGLRLLPGKKADDILQAVGVVLRESPFLLKPGAVGIMDGAHEGAYAWLTLNYLLGRLGAGPDATVAAIDLGGGSVQEAFALPEAEAAGAPEGYVTAVRAGPQRYTVYVHSYLGFGLMAARAKVIESGLNSSSNGSSGNSGSSGGNSSSGGSGNSTGSGGVSHPCFARGTRLSYSYAGRDYKVDEVIDAGDFKRCAEAALKALDHDRDCGGPKGSCSFNGAWRGKPASMRRVYYVSSFFFDRALDAGIIADPAATEWRTTPKEFARRAAAVCGKDPAEIAAQFELQDAAAAPYFCLDLSFCHTVLTEGFDLAESDHLTLVKKVEHNGQLIEASWPLGAAIDELSAAAGAGAAEGRGGGGGPRRLLERLWGTRVEARALAPL